MTVLTKQRLLGVFLLILGAVSAIPDRDATACIFIWTLFALPLLFTKRRITYFEEDEEEYEDEE